MTEESSPIDEIGGSDRAEADAQPAVRRCSRRKRVVIGLAAVVVIAIFLAPTGIARFLESNGLTLSDRQGTVFQVHIGQASLGWFSPTRLSDIRIDDASGQTLLTVERIVSARTLVSLAVNRFRTGRFFIDQPSVNVVVRPDGSNLEDFLQLLRSRSRSDSRMTQVAATITQGRISFVDEKGTELASVAEVDITGERRRDADQSLSVELRGTVVDDGERRLVEAAAEWTGPRDGLPFLSGVGTAAVKFAPFPLAPLQSRLRRIAPDVTLRSGSLSGQFLVDVSFEGSQSLSATGEFISRDVHAVRRETGSEPAEIRWSEESLAVNLNGRFDADSASIQITDASVTSTPVVMTARGTIEQLSGECLIDLTGDLSYDIGQWIQVMAAGAAEHVHVEGLQTRQVGIHGPLAKVINARPQWDLSRLRVTADVGWDTADVFGVRSEQATIAATVHNGVLEIAPTDVPISGGRFLAAPQVDLFGDPPAAAVGRGPALEAVEFSPEMCHLWLKFLSPILADATRVNGRFSIHLDEGRVPLRSAADGHVSGLLHVHSAEVRPGPFAERIINLISTIKSLIDRTPGGIGTDRLVITMEDQRIPFAMTDGRVHHEQLEFIVAGAVVRTSGSVGLDESLDLLVEIPLPESWFRQPLLAETFGGEVIEIPVRGTFTSPQFDLADVRELARRFAMRGVGGLLQKLLD